MLLTVANAYIQRVIDRLTAKVIRLVQPWPSHSVASYCSDRVATLLMFLAIDASRSLRCLAVGEATPSGNEFGGGRLAGVSIRLAYSRL